MSSNFNAGNTKPLQTFHTPVTSATSPKTKTTGPEKNNHIRMKNGAAPKQRPTNEKRKALLEKKKERTANRGKVAEAHSAAASQLTKTSKATTASVKALNSMVGKWNKDQKLNLKALNAMSGKTLERMKDTRDAMVKLGGALGMSEKEVSAFIAGKGDGKLAKLSPDSPTRMMMTHLRDQYGVMQKQQGVMQDLVDGARERDTRTLSTTIVKNTDKYTENALLMQKIENNLINPNDSSDLLTLSDEETKILDDQPLEKTPDRTEAPKTQKTPQKETIETVIENAEAPVDKMVVKETAPKVKEAAIDQTEAPKTQKAPQKETIEAVIADAEAPVDKMVEKETAPKVAKEAADQPDKILDSPADSSKQKTEAPRPNEKVRIGDDDQQRLMNEKKDSIARATRQEPSKTEAPRSNEKVRIGDDDYRRLADERKSGADFAPRTALPLADRQARLNEMEKQILPLLREYFQLMTGGADAPKGPAVQRPPIPERKSIVKNAVGDVNASLRNPEISDKVRENAPAVPKAINTMVGGMNMPNPMQSMMAMFLVGVLSKLLGMDLSAFAQLGKMFPGGQNQNRN